MSAISGSQYPTEFMVLDRSRDLAWILWSRMDQDSPHYKAERTRLRRDLIKIEHITASSSFDPNEKLFIIQNEDMFCCLPIPLDSRYVWIKPPRIESFAQSFKGARHDQSTWGESEYSFFLLFGLIHMFD